MAFHVKGEFIENCSCNMLCPCWFGEQDLMIMDRGWCATPVLVRIQEGTSDGVDISELNVVVGLFFPGPTLFDGNGTARVYVDDRTTPEQERELEKIFQAKEGGPMEVPASLMARWLPTKRARIEVTAENGTVNATVEGLGEIVSRRLVNEAGDRMTLQNTPFTAAFEFQDQTGQLAPSAGTSWNDPDLPETWESRSGVVGQIDWRVA